jgi:hypothetical protein
LRIPEIFAASCLRVLVALPDLQQLGRLADEEDSRRPRRRTRAQQQDRLLLLDAGEVEQVGLRTIGLSASALRGIWSFALTTASEFFAIIFVRRFRFSEKRAGSIGR